MPIAQPRPRDPADARPGLRLDEDCKRLLAAILEFSFLARPAPERPAPESQELRGRPAASRLDLDRAMHERGLGARHATALLSIALYGPLTVTQLAKCHHVTVKTASLVAVELENAGLIERREDPADRRRTIVAIAIGKERAVDAGLRRRAAPLQRTLNRLTPSHREGLITGLEVLAEELSRDREQGATARPKRPAPKARL